MQFICHALHSCLPHQALKLSCVHIIASITSHGSIKTLQIVAVINGIVLYTTSGCYFKNICMIHNNYTTCVHSLFYSLLCVCTQVFTLNLCMHVIWPRKWNSQSWYMLDVARLLLIVWTPFIMFGTFNWTSGFSWLLGEWKEALGPLSWNDKPY